MRSFFTYVSGAFSWKRENEDNVAGRAIQAVIRHIRRIFTLDLRALALMRIGMAALILLDLSIRGSDLEAHYSDTGVLPLDVLFGYNWGQFNLSIHTISGLWQVQAVLFIIAAVFAIMLMLGYKTRLATIVSWFLLLSLQNRNPMILQGGDDLFRMILFWGMFLPWGERYSVDSMGRQEIQTDHGYCGMAGVAYMLQVGFVYFFSALLKTSPEWRTEGTAIYYALSLDQMRLPLGDLIYPYPELLKWMTFFVFYIELFVMFLFFIPVYTVFFRALGVVTIIGLHLGISGTLFVGLFFIIGIITTFGMFPPRWMDWIDKRTMRLGAACQSGITKARVKVRELVDCRLAFRLKKMNRQAAIVAREVTVIFFLLFVAAWNLQNVDAMSNVTEKVNWLGLMPRVDQNWGMFSPGVFKDDGWYVLEGTTIDNEKIDLNRNGKPLSYEKPERVVALFSNDRWRKFSENYLFVSNAYLRPYYADMVLRRWNEENPERQIKKLEVIYMKEVTAPDYRHVRPVREVLSVRMLKKYIVNNEYLATENEADEFER
jgi:hypothetical protein